MTPRLEMDDKGEIDEVVSDAGGHLERLSNKGWFLRLNNADGSSVAIWIKGKVTMHEFREPMVLKGAKP